MMNILSFWDATVSSLESPVHLIPAFCPAHFGIALSPHFPSQVQVPESMLDMAPLEDFHLLIVLANIES